MTRLRWSPNGAYKCAPCPRCMSLPELLAGCSFSSPAPPTASSSSPSAGGGARAFCFQITPPGCPPSSSGPTDTTLSRPPFGLPQVEAHLLALHPPAPPSTRAAPTTLLLSPAPRTFTEAWCVRGAQRALAHSEPYCH